MRNHPLVRLIELTLDKYQRDNVGALAAALAYFTIFAIFPLLLVITSVVGFFVDPAQYDVQQLLLKLVGSPEVRDLIAQTLTSFAAARVGAGVVGVLTLLFAATGIFGALQRTFKEIWEVRPIAQAGNVTSVVKIMVIDRAIAFGLLLGVAALILVAVLGNIALNLLGAYTDWVPLNSILLGFARFALVIALITVAFATLYKVLPNSVPQWSDVLPAALLAAISFTILQRVADLIFGRLNFSSFGVLGGSMALLMWIYLSSQILLVGGELSYAWAHVLGSRKATTGKLEAVGSKL